MNGFFIVGNLVAQPKIKTTASGLKMAQLIVDVPKNFRNQEGEIEIERYSCTIWRAVAESVIDLCKIGDTLAIRGRLQANNYTSKENEVRFGCDLIAENVSIVKQEG